MLSGIAVSPKPAPVTSECLGAVGGAAADMYVSEYVNSFNPALYGKPLQHCVGVLAAM